MSASGDVARAQPLWERDDFPSADAKYAALVNGDERDGLPVIVGPGLSRYDMPWTISAGEMAVFGLERASLAALYWSYVRYECLVGTVDAFFSAYAVEERSAFAAYVARGENVDDAAAFMRETTGLPYAQCLGWALKVQAADIRGGLYRNAGSQVPMFDDDIPF